MIRSMTSFGRETALVNGKEITAEIKSVNSRFLDLNIKISKVFSYLEENVRGYLRDRGITRGKVDVYIGVDIVENVGVTLHLDESYARSYIEAVRELQSKFGLKDDITAMNIAQNRDIFTVDKPEEDMEKSWAEVLPVLEKAVDMFIAGKEREGEKLATDLVSKRNELEVMVGEIEKMSEKCTGGYMEKLEARLRQLLDDHNIKIDESRLLTECAIFADKVAVDEETVRLRSHLNEFDRIMTSGEPVSKPLDYLIQEINRETNTIGSKANDAEMAHKVVNMKNLIEKIREQVQNLE